MYKYYKDGDIYVVSIVVPGFLTKAKTYEYVCSTEAEVRALVVPEGAHIADPGLMVTPTVLIGKSALECVTENNLKHKGQLNIT